MHYNHQTLLSINLLIFGKVMNVLFYCNNLLMLYLTSLYRVKSPKFLQRINTLINFKTRHL